MTPQTLQELVLLNRLSLTGAKSVHGLLLNGQTPAEILRQIREENFLNKKTALAELCEIFDPEKEVETARTLGVRLLTILDEDYPRVLQTIFDPPLVLYVMGNILEADRAGVAIVGTRHPSFYGTSQTKKFSRELSEKGFTIVSGLAQGIDQIAHEAALQISYGRTIGVLGCGMDIDYPSGSKKLREAMALRGAVITEYAFGTSPRAENFPRRNRIIAGLSLGTLVVEAHSRSGSLITAHLAVEEGREVFAVPGAVDQLGSRGTNHLIKEGAHLVESTEDIVSVLAPIISIQIPKEIPETAIHASAEKLVIPVPEEKNPENSFLDSRETEVMGLLNEMPLSGEEIEGRVTCLPAQTKAALTFLELKGRIRRRHDGVFALTERN